MMDKWSNTAPPPKALLLLNEIMVFPLIVVTECDSYIAPPGFLASLPLKLKVLFSSTVILTK